VNSIRSQLTVWYTVALGATVVAFGLALYVERRASSLEELDQRLTIEADFVSQFLSQSYQVMGELTEPDPRLPPEVPEAQRPRQLVATSQAFLDGLADFLIVVDPLGHRLYVTDTTGARRPIRFDRLAEDPLVLTGATVDRLLELARPPVAQGTGTLEGDPVAGSIRYLVLRVPGAGFEIGALVVATALTNIAFGPGQLLGSMLLILPVILLGSIAIGYLLAGTSLRPLKGMMEELKAITDGRSLHRRLAVPHTGDELASLARSANQMIGRLEQSFDSLRRFSADASHELKTPLMILRAGVERALTNPETPTESLEELDRVLEEINRMTEMIDNLLTLARVDEGRAALALTQSDLRDLITDMEETAEILAEPDRIRVSISMPDEPVLLPIDRGRMQQLLLNLVTNAIKYTPAGGTVSIRLADENDIVTIAVHDTGVGIRAKDIPHIFDRFYRADLARSRSGDRPGVGLGLAITKWIAEAHGGTITATSRPGRGTAFSVRIPRSAPALVPDEV
jgi:two-component system OmpR family sensor kinase